MASPPPTPQSPERRPPTSRPPAGPPGSPTPAPADRSTPTLTIGLLGLALVLLVVLVVTWGDDRGSTPDLDAATAAASSQQREVTAAAGREALTFLEVDHRDMGAVVDEVLAGATGAFADEYAADRDRLVRSVERRSAVVEASLRAVGVVPGADTDADTDDVVVLVAADSLLRDDDTGDDGVLRRHRMRLTMTGTAEGWRVSGLEFVR